MKVKGLVNNIIGEFNAEPVETIEQDEPITFNSKTELDLYILDLLSKIIYEDENNGQ